MILLNEKSNTMPANTSLQLKSYCCWCCTYRTQVVYVYSNTFLTRESSFLINMLHLIIPLTSHANILFCFCVACGHWWLAHVANLIIKLLFLFAAIKCVMLFAGKWRERKECKEKHLFVL